MASDREIIAEQVRGTEEPRAHGKRGKSKGPTTDVLEDRIVGMETAMSSMDATVGALTDRFVGLEDRLEGLDTRFDDLETEYGEVKLAAKSMILEHGQTLKSEIQSLTVSFAKEISGLRSFVESELRALRTEVAEVRTEWDGHKHLAGSCSTGASPYNAIQVPKPSTYNGTRNATEVENFLFGLEQYFEAKGVMDDATRIGSAPTYLREAAQLWWRRKHSDASKGVCSIRTWHDFKRELKKQFSPSNADKEARGRLRRLKQQGHIRDYIREFTTLILEIDDMSDKDSLFYFMDGLKDWAKVELERRGVRTLDAAIAAAESLTDYRKEKNTKEIGGGDEDDQGSEEGDLHNSKPIKGGKQDKPQEGKSRRIKPPSPCHICNGPHWVRDCPRKQNLNAMLAQFEANKAQSAHSEETQAIMGSLRQIGALRSTPTHTPTPPNRKGLMFVKAKVNGRDTTAMLDTGATHNFISTNEAKRLGLTIANGEGIIKAVNSPPTAIAGIAKSVSTTIGTWSSKLDYSIVAMDDFDMVLGIDFFDQTNAIPMPATRTLIILDGDRSCTVPIERMVKKVPQVLSALQLEEGSEDEDEGHTFAPVNPAIQAIIEKYKDAAKPQDPSSSNGKAVHSRKGQQAKSAPLSPKASTKPKECSSPLKDSHRDEQDKAKIEAQPTKDLPQGKARGSSPKPSVEYRQKLPKTNTSPSGESNIAAQEHTSHKHVQALECKDKAANAPTKRSRRRHRRSRKAHPRSTSPMESSKPSPINGQAKGQPKQRAVAAPSYLVASLDIYLTPRGSARNEDVAKSGGGGCHGLTFSLPTRG